MGFKSFEDLEVYKAAREFRKKIYKLIKCLIDISPISKKEKPKAPINIVSLISQ